MTRLSSRTTAASLTLACALLISACEQKAEQASQQQPAPKVGIVTLSSQSYTLTSELPGRTAWVITIPNFLGFDLVTARHNRIMGFSIGWTIMDDLHFIARNIN